MKDWIVPASVQAGKLFRKVSSAGKPWGDGVTEKLVGHVVKEFAARIGNDRLAPHDLRSYAEDRIMPNGLVYAPSLAWFSLDHAA